MKRGLSTHQRACKGLLNTTIALNVPVPQVLLSASPPNSAPVSSPASSPISPSTTLISPSTSKAVRRLQSRQPGLLAKGFGELLASLKATVPTLRRVPKGARLELARVLVKVILRVTQENSEEAWRDLLVLPYSTLNVPRECDEVKNLTKWVKEQVSSWSRDFSVPQARSRPALVRKFRPDSDVALAKKIEAKLGDGDIRGAIRLACSEDTIAPNDAVTLASLEQKHPAHPHDLVFPTQPLNANCPPVLDSEVTHAVKSFPAGSAGGLDGLRPQILKDLLAPNLGETGLLAAIGKLVDLMLRDDIPPSIIPNLFGASLTALKKKTGGIRPIAVGLVWRRLAAKVVVSRVTPELEKKFSPHQLGVGVRGGAEAGAHAARRYWAAEHEGPRAFLKVDFRNAFNELYRDKMLEEVAAHLPHYFHFISSSYSKPSHLFFQDRLILSQRGVQQGDPLGPALFALTIHPVVSSITSEFNVWYLDDGTVADEPDRVVQSLNLIRDRGREIGLHLNEDKCEVGVLGALGSAATEAAESILAAAPSIKVFGSCDAVLLGAPISDEAISGVLGIKTKALATFARRLKCLSAHSAFFLLRASVSIPRLIYFLRCAPTWRQWDSLKEYDAVLKTTMESILNCELSSEAWLQSSLPVQEGGLGVRHAVDMAVPCFLASIHSVLPLVDSLLPPNLRNCDAALDEGLSLRQGLAVPDVSVRGFQSEWEKPVMEMTLNSLKLSAPNAQATARLLALQQPNAGDWLHALPSPQLGTLLDNESFRVICALRLGGSVCQPHRCSCGEEVCANGYHGLKCKFSRGRRSRHEAVNDILSRALRTAEVPNVREPPGCSRQDGKKPDGLTLVPWKRGRSLVWDFTCADTLCPTHVLQTVRHPGAAARSAEAGKKRKYAFLEDRFFFVPVAVETLGAYGSEAVTFIDALGERLKTVSGDARAAFFLKQRISLAVQRGNAAAILGTLPAGKSFSEIFNL